SFLSKSPFAAAVHAGTVYRTHVPIDSSVGAPQVFLGDQSMSEAAFPDPAPDPLEPAVEVARGGSNNSSIADAALNQPEGYWKGAHVYEQTTFVALTGVVQASTPGSVAVTPLNANDTCGAIVPNSTRYFLYGKLEELNAPREWYYDRGSQTLYLRSPDGTQPAPDAVTVKQRSYGFDLSGVTGVAMLGHDNTVTNNVIHDVDASGGRPAGVHLVGHDQTITHNTIYSVGRAGIETAQVAPATATSLQNNRVAYNDISRYGRLEQDFGGIYICCNLDFKGSSIDHNWVHEPQDMAGVGA